MAPRYNYTSVADQLRLIAARGNEDRQTVEARNAPSDIDFQWQDAVETYRRRAANPRFIPGARVEYPDAPDLLERELLAPFRRGSSAGGGSTQPVQNRLISNAGNAWMVNPATGEATQIIKSEPKRTMSFWDREIGKSAIRKVDTTQKALADALPRQKPAAQLDYDKAVSDLETLKKQDFLQAPTDLVAPQPAATPTAIPTSTPAAPAKRGWGYIGTGAGENLYSDATGMTDAPTVAPGFDWSNPGGGAVVPQAVQAPADLLQPTERGFPVNDALSPVPGPQAAPVNEAQSTPVAPSEPPSVISQSDFNKLPSGATYLNKGKLHRKP